MFRSTHTLGCILVLSMAAVLVTPGLSRAQRAGRGGGGHYGGGYHAGAYHGAAYSGGYRYGYRPHYGSYGYSPYLYDVPTYGSVYPPLHYGDANYGALSTDAYQPLYPPPAVLSPSDTSADIIVTVPPGAEVWFDGAATTSTGTVREFNSPPLTPGNHSYEIRARWNEDGHEVIQTQRVEVTPGAHVNVGFPVSSAVLGQATKKS